MHFVLHLQGSHVSLCDVEGRKRKTKKEKTTTRSMDCICQCLACQGVCKWCLSVLQIHWAWGDQRNEQLLHPVMQHYTISSLVGDWVLSPSQPWLKAAVVDRLLKVIVLISCPLPFSLTECSLKIKRLTVRPAVPISTALHISLRWKCESENIIRCYLVKQWTDWCMTWVIETVSYKHLVQVKINESEKCSSVGRKVLPATLYLL